MSIIFTIISILSIVVLVIGIPNLYILDKVVKNKHSLRVELMYNFIYNRKIYKTYKTLKDTKEPIYLFRAKENEQGKLCYVNSAMSDFREKIKPGQVYHVLFENEPDTKGNQGIFVILNEYNSDLIINGFNSKMIEDLIETNGVVITDKIVKAQG